MIMTIEEFRSYIATEEPDAVIEARLGAIEQLVRSYTHNNFQKRNIRAVASIIGGTLIVDPAVFQEGDTVEISGSLYNEGVYVFPVTGLTDEDSVTVTKVVYPADVKLGVINMIKWDLENRDKVGVQSETISRHSVTYFNLDGDNSVVGFPKSLIGFLEPYRKARF